MLPELGSDEPRLERICIPDPAGLLNGLRNNSREKFQLVNLEAVQEIVSLGVGPYVPGALDVQGLCFKGEVPDEDQDGLIKAKCNLRLGE